MEPFGVEEVHAIDRPHYMNGFHFLLTFLFLNVFGRDCFFAPGMDFFGLVLELITHLRVRNQAHSTCLTGRLFVYTLWYSQNIALKQFLMLVGHSWLVWILARLESHGCKLWGFDLLFYGVLNYAFYLLRFLLRKLFQGSFWTSYWRLNILHLFSFSFGASC